jgi:hypothetical protein
VWGAGRRLFWGLKSPHAVITHALGATHYAAQLCSIAAHNTHCLYTIYQRVRVSCCCIRPLKY